MSESPSQEASGQPDFLIIYTGRSDRSARSSMNGDPLVEDPKGVEGGFTSTRLDFATRAERYTSTTPQGVCVV